MIETVLLIDDDEAAQFIQKRAITKHDKIKNIITFSEGKVALEYLKIINLNFIHKPQLILLDLDMPLMNGWEFLEKYMNLDDDLIQHSKLFILTASNDLGNIERSKKIRGVSGYLNKPLTEQVLDDILRIYFIDLVKKYNNLTLTSVLSKN